MSSYYDNLTTTEKLFRSSRHIPKLRGEEEEEAGTTTSTNRREFVYRVGALYEFEIGKLLVTPQVHYDYCSGNDAVVYATALGFNF